MTSICKGCGKPIAEGEARYTGAEHKEEFWHWDCREASALKLEADLRAAGEGEVADWMERARKDPLILDGASTAAVQENKMTISITTKSYPFLAMAQDWDVPYWVVLCCRGNDVWAELARDWLNTHLTPNDVMAFYDTLSEYEAVARRPS